MSKHKQTSFICFLLCIFILTSAAFCFYPKWKKKDTEATLSWDVSGYYTYLPAAFIYKDLKQVKFLDNILKEYRPTPYPGQAFQHESDNMVMKYSMGLAVQYLPFFAIGHTVASLSDYPADGFSYPYQVAISWGSLLIAFMGLYFLRQNLKQYFEDTTVGITLLLLVFGTNYLDYASITAAMSHNYLFTLYCLLIALTITYHRQASLLKGAGIGAIIGLMALTRPTEVIACLIPLLWNVPSLKVDAINKRFQFLTTNYKSILLATLVCISIGSLQLFYWKHVSGDWIVYSYQDQGFSWLKPHLSKGLFSYQAGWLVYSPMMVFALLGFVALWRQYSRSIFWAITIFSLLFIYITFAWDIWWYGGSLGQRAMVQAYAVLAFPLAAFVQRVHQKAIWKWLFLGLVLLFSYYNLWLTYQAHGGGLLKTDGSTTSAYFWRTIGRYDVPTETFKLLDTDELFSGTRKDIKLIYQNDFEKDTLDHNCDLEPIQGQLSFCLKAGRIYMPAQQVALQNQDAEWVRAAADIRIGQKEWNKWKMNLFTIQFKNKKQVVKERYIRVQRFLNGNDTKRIHIDAQLPDKSFDHIEVFFWSNGGTVPILIDNLTVETFNS